MDTGISKRLLNKKQDRSTMSKEDSVIFEALVAYRDKLLKDEYTSEVRIKLCILNENILQLTKHL